MCFWAKIQEDFRDGSRHHCCKVLATLLFVTHKAGRDHFSLLGVLLPLSSVLRGGLMFEQDLQFDPSCTPEISV